MSGLVEIVNVHNGNQWAVFLNGLLVEQLHNETFMSVIDNATTRARWAYMVQVCETALRYTVYAKFCEQAALDLLDTYCADHFYDYHSFCEIVKMLELRPCVNHVSYKHLGKFY